MKVKMLVSIAGPRFCVEPGGIYQCGDAEGARLIAAGFATPWSKKIERTVQPLPPETR